jgi:predicted ribosomally synthesized peptide with nif11-like leader
MTLASAKAAIDRMETDEAFANRVKDAGGPDESIALLTSEGFHVTRGDMHDALLDRFGDQLTQEQLDAIAGGADVEEEMMIGLTILGIGLSAAVGAAV